MSGDIAFVCLLFLVGGANALVEIRTYSVTDNSTFPNDNDTVVVHYNGTLPNGQEFDSSMNREPFSFVVGQGNVIPGWDIGIKAMSVGERAKMIITYDDAYGDVGVMDTTDVKIHPFETLIFDIELLNVIRANGDGSSNGKRRRNRDRRPADINRDNRGDNQLAFPATTQDINLPRHSDRGQQLNARQNGFPPASIGVPPQTQQWGVTGASNNLNSERRRSLRQQQLQLLRLQFQQRQQMQRQRQGQLSPQQQRPQQQQRPPQQQRPTRQQRPPPQQRPPRGFFNPMPMNFRSGFTG